MWWEGRCRGDGVCVLCSLHRSSLALQKPVPVVTSKPQPAPQRAGSFWMGPCFTCWVLIRQLGEGEAEGSSYLGAQLSGYRGQPAPCGAWLRGLGGVPRQCPSRVLPRNCCRWEARHGGGINLTWGWEDWPGAQAVERKTSSPLSCTVSLSHLHHLRAMSQHSAVSLGRGV